MKQRESTIFPQREREEGKLVVSLFPSVKEREESNTSCFPCFPERGKERKGKLVVSLFPPAGRETYPLKRGYYFSLPYRVKPLHIEACPFMVGPEPPTNQETTPYPLALGATSTFVTATLTQQQTNKKQKDMAMTNGIDNKEPEAHMIECTFDDGRTVMITTETLEEVQYNKKTNEIIVIHMDGVKNEIFQNCSVDDFERLTRDDTEDGRFMMPQMANAMEKLRIGEVELSMIDLSGKSPEEIGKVVAEALGVDPAMVEDRFNELMDSDDVSLHDLGQAFDDDVSGDGQEDDDHED